MKRLISFVAIWAVVVLGAVLAAQYGAATYQEMLRLRAMAGLEAIGLDWAVAEPEGLYVALSGEAPDSLAQDLAVETLIAVLPGVKILDRSTAVPPPLLPLLPLRIEFHRDEGRLILLGQVPDQTMRRAVIGMLGQSAPLLNVTDYLALGARAAPESWGPELPLAVLAAARVPQARVEATPGLVHIEGRVRNRAHRIALEEELQALAGSGVGLSLTLREPRPVIAPFTVSAWRDGQGGLRVEACAARTAEEAAAFASLFARHGAADHGQSCKTGLGGPGGDWAGAVEAALAALSAAQSGRVALIYRHAVLSVAASEASRLPNLLAALREDLPEGYTAEGRTLDPGTSPETAPDLPHHWLRLSRQEDGVALDGHVPSALAGQTLETLAAARFGADLLRARLTVRPNSAQPGWEGITGATLEALGALQTGVALITQGRVILQGSVADPARAGEVHRALAEALPELRVESALTIDLPGAMAEFPATGPRCEHLLNALVARNPIAFAPGSAVIDEASTALLAEAAAILRTCPGAVLEIGGHTDSQGSASLNMRLSKARAHSVLTGLLSAGTGLAQLRATGYGEDQPIASNETEEGRALNRRIAFKALESGETQEDPSE